MSDLFNTLRGANLIEVINLYLEAKTGEIELVGLLPPETVENILLLRKQLEEFIDNRIGIDPYKDF